METFVVRVWTPVDAVPVSAPPTELHGLIEHIGSERESAFRNAEELLELIRAGLKATVGRTGRMSPHDGRPPEE